MSDYKFKNTFKFYTTNDF